MDIPSPNAAALEITEFLLPYIGMVMIVIIGFMIKDFATKMSKGRDDTNRIWYTKNSW